MVVPAAPVGADAVSEPAAGEAGVSLPETDVTTSDTGLPVTAPSDEDAPSIPVCVTPVTASDPGDAPSLTPAVVPADPVTASEPAPETGDVSLAPVTAALASPDTPAVGVEPSTGPVAVTASEPTGGVPAPGVSLAPALNVLSAPAPLTALTVVPASPETAVAPDTVDSPAGAPLAPVPPVNGQCPP